MNFVEFMKRPAGVTPVAARAADERRDFASDDNWPAPFWTAPSVTGIYVSQNSALAASAVMAAVTMLAEDVAKLTPRLFRKDKSGLKQEASDHWLFDLLDLPNEWQNWMEFCEQLMVGLVMRGNGYVVIIRNSRGQPIRLVPINPDYVAIWESPDGSIFYRVTASGLHLAAMLRGLPPLIPAEDMFHIRGFSTGGLVGLSRIGVAREAIAVVLAQEQQAARWMGNGAKPAGVLTTDQKLDKAAAERIAADWKAIHGGLQNVGRTAVLEQGLKWQQLSMTSTDMEFIASRQFQLQEIARIFRIPPHMIGELSRSTNNNIVQQAQEYANYTLSSYTKRWERKLSSLFGLRKQGLFIEFDMAELLRADVQSRFNIYRTAIMSMIMTPNEARVDAGLDPIDDPDADKLQKPANMAAAGSQSTGTLPDGGGHPAAGDTTT